MPNTMTLINTITVGSGGAASITFSSIPQIYTDLKILISARNASNNYGGYQVRLNGATTNNSYRSMRASGGGVASSLRSDMIDVCSLPISSDTAGTFSCDEVYIPNYSSTTQYKSFSADSIRGWDTSTDNSLKLSGALYSSNSAITSIVITLDTDSFAQNTVASLYGIKNS